MLNSFGDTPLRAKISAGAPDKFQMNKGVCFPQIGGVA